MRRKLLRTPADIEKAFADLEKKICCLNPGIGSIATGADLPADPIEGKLYYFLEQHVYIYHNGTEWKTLDNSDLVI